MKLLCTTLLMLLFLCCTPLSTKEDNSFDNSVATTSSELFLKEFSKDLISDLELLAKVWGFLKYHHPEVAKGTLNWDSELITILPLYIDTHGIQNRSQLLLTWIEDLGIVPKCNNCITDSNNLISKSDLSWVNDIIDKRLKENIYNIFYNRNQGFNFYIRMDSMVGNPIFTNERIYNNMPYPDLSFRLLSLFRYWNIINYYYPYKYLIDKEWGCVLNEYIETFIDAQNEYDYELAVVKLLSEVGDSHATLLSGNDAIEKNKGYFMPSFYTKFVENKLVVVSYCEGEFSDLTKLKIGDIITHIRGKKIQKLIYDKLEYYPASNYSTKLRNMSNDMLRSCTSSIEIEYISDGVKFNKLLNLVPENAIGINNKVKKDSSNSYKFLTPELGYINLESVTKSQIVELKNKFINCKGIIVDIRNYPSEFLVYELGAFFVSTTTPFAKISHGNLNTPGEFKFNRELYIHNQGAYFQGKLIVLVNEQTQSRAEFTALALKAGVNTTILGSTTAGTDGNVSSVVLPGGLRTRISGIGIYYPDGTETQKVGIVPDIHITPTVNGIKAGKDELLEKAIELIIEN